MDRMPGQRATDKEQALWLLEEFAPGTGVNNLCVAFSVEGRLRRPLLVAAVTRAVRRHQALRTVFRIEPEGMVKEILPADRVELSLEELPDAAPGEDRVELTRFLGRPFATDGGLLVRMAVQTRHDASGNSREVYCVAIHHAVFDGLSSALLLGELVASYNTLAAGGDSAEPEVVPAWQEPAPSEASAAFWREKLAGFRAADLDLWCERPEAAGATLTGQVVNWELSRTARDAVRRMQKELRAPESVVLLAAYGVLLAAHGAGPDLTIGSPVSVRSPEAAAAIGYHINVLTLRVPIDPAAGFRSYVKLARRTFMESASYADYPVDELLGLVEREGWRNNLFRHAFNYVPDMNTRFELDGLPAAPELIENGFSKFDLEFFVTSAVESLRIRAAFCVDVLDPADVRLLLARYEELLVALAEAPDRPLAEAPVWSDRDRAVIGAANATDRELPRPTVLELIAERVSAAPAEDAAAQDTAVRDSSAQNAAVLDRDRAFGLRRLWAAAEATRDRLLAAGVGRGDVVALLAPRSAELAAAALGVWLTGAAYLPLDPDHPEQRLRHQLDDSGAAAVLLGEGVTAPGERTTLALVDVGSVEPVAGPVEPTGGATGADLAYLIYTSGSTGLPKGTLLNHRNLANLITHFADDLRVGPADTVLWLTTFSFDISALELFLPLVTGARLAVAPAEARTDGAELAAALRRYNATVVQATPTTWRLVIDQVADGLAGRRVLSGGEPLPAVLAGKLAATGCELTNVYGPTETTIWSTAGRIEAGAARVDVGMPIANTQVFVAAPDGRALPLGTRGELCIAGQGVAVGYHDRPELTAQRFGEHPEFGRFYRTGDAAAWTHDGRLEILGRLDRQIKLRGNRIELGEVEGVLLAHPDVHAAAVVVAEDAEGDAALWAFVVVRERADAVGGLWEHAHASLPYAATPQEYVAVDAFPMTGNDKVDYSALRRRAEELLAARAAEARENGTDGAGSAAAADGGAAGSGDELLDAVLPIWNAVLGRSGLGADSHFFADGGHSLLGVKLLQEIHKSTGVRLKLQDLFEGPTPQALVRAMRAVGAADAS
ncbi:amino acid adenylation domain-containing protein [Streptomyces mobaraensis]|uniref:non-ribosomal peptide synthetase n=1 Tax=Streptomyces mobaraensis TaxID=35621 RepID=UPI00332BA5D0